MTKLRCPGVDMSHWRPKDVFEMPCPDCQAPVEFFKDDPQRQCPSCGRIVRNLKIDLGCAKWCKYAKECLGDLAHARGLVSSMCDRLVHEMKEVFSGDEHRIDHTRQVLAYAETILEAETADPLTVKAAAILHDIGIHEAERKHGSPAAKSQEIEGPPIARKIMEKLKLDEETIDHVCRIVGAHHSARDIDTIEFRIIWDADWLVNLPRQYTAADRDTLTREIDRIFKTKPGKTLARKLFLSQKAEADDEQDTPRKH